MNVELSPKSLKELSRLHNPIRRRILTDLTDEEKEVIAQGMEEYKRGGFISLEEAKKMLE